MTIPQALALAMQHHRAGRLAEAEPLYRQILAVDPRHPDALHLLGVIAHQAGQHAEAQQWIERAIAVNATWPEYHNNLGNVLHARGDFAGAVASFRTALRLDGDHARAWANLGRTLVELGAHEEAATACQAALRLEPRFAEAHYTLGVARTRRGDFTGAIAAFRAALEVRPDLVDAQHNLGNLLLKLGDLDAAAAAFREALRLAPNSAQIHADLGGALERSGELELALASHRRAIALAPGDAAFHSSLLYLLHYHPGYDRAALLREHRMWAARHAAPRTFLSAGPAARAEMPAVLRIGYVSPDLRDHPVGRFLLPVLENHDPAGFEIFCYAGSRPADSWTERLRRCAHGWREIGALSDEAAADLIRRDRIDVLVDLSAHSAGHRLLVFARRPASVQVTYLGYCSTTGMDAMDYRLTDPHLDPPGDGDAHYAERSIRLPETYWCYRPSDAPAEVSPLPALAAGHVTFGCLNHFGKVSPAALVLWLRVLRAVPTSRLLLHAEQGAHRQRVFDLFSAAGIAPQRVRFVARRPRAEYLALYHGIDLALDPFPYGGGTTTCDGLWMGVPVVSLAGETAVSRAGLSLLTAADLPELVAHSKDEYLQIATALATDLPRLAELRATLRPRLQASPLMDAPRFTRHLEAAFRAIWQRK